MHIYLSLRTRLRTSLSLLSFFLFPLFCWKRTRKSARLGAKAFQKECKTWATADYIRLIPYNSLLASLRSYCFVILRNVLRMRFAASYFTYRPSYPLYEPLAVFVRMYEGRSLSVNWYTSCPPLQSHTTRWALSQLYPLFSFAYVYMLRLYRGAGVAEVSGLTGALLTLNR